MPTEVAEQFEIKFGYETREHQQVQRFREQEFTHIPPEFDYRGLPGLSREVQEKLMRICPANLGQAGSISGVTPAALAVVRRHLHRLFCSGNGITWQPQTVGAGPALCLPGSLAWDIIHTSR
ncbi:tRNA uridine 5-carboxymethylaminomethyl modification enzyme MnmG (modular protein) [Desulfarculales bacterium]